MAGKPARWGFHELSDHYARRLVAHADVKPGELVVDVGAGRGSITGPLLDRDARVIAVELHPGRARALRARFATGQLRVVEADLRTWRFPTGPYRVVANPPFALLAETLRRITAPRSRLAGADLVVPAYLAARWARGAGYHPDHYDASIICRLPADAFRPAATQPTAVLRLRLRRGR